MIGTPKDVMVDDNKVPRNGVTLVKHVLVDALDVVHRHRQRFNASKEDQNQTHQNRPHLDASHCVCAPLLGFYYFERKELKVREILVKGKQEALSDLKD